MSKKVKILSVEEVLAQALKQSPDKTLGNVPVDVWYNLLLNVNVLDLLNLATIARIGHVLYNDAFWKQKFLVDFPDLVEIVGTNLPVWIVPGDAKAPKFKDLPWRRYYNVIRFFMKKMMERLIEIAQVDQNEFARVYSTGYHPHMIRARLQNDLYRVEVEIFERVFEPGNHFVWRRGDQITSTGTYTIWEFCQSFLLTNLQDTTEDELYQFFKPLNTLNLIRIWLRFELYLSVYASDRTDFLRQYDLFVSWITSIIPIQNPFWISDLIDWHTLRFNRPHGPYGHHETIDERMESNRNDLIRYFQRHFNEHVSLTASLRELVNLGRTGYQQGGILLLGSSCDHCFNSPNFEERGTNRFFCNAQCQASFHIK